MTDPVERLRITQLPPIYIARGHKIPKQEDLLPREPADSCEISAKPEEKSHKAAAKATKPDRESGLKEKPDAESDREEKPAGKSGQVPSAIFIDEEAFNDIVCRMPKVELHTHIEGSVRPRTILELARQYDIELPAETVRSLRDKISMKKGENLLDFLKKFDCFRFVFDKPETLRRIAYESIQDNARDNVRYTELRMNPLKHPDILSIQKVLDAVLDGMERAKSDFGVDAGFIVSINRGYDVDSAMEVAKAAVARKNRGVVGLDLAGDEIHNPPEKFKKVFQYAKSHGLKVTIHAGEAVGPESIRKAVEVCKADRIGHGVRVQEDPELMALLKKKGTLLELCPSSNIQLGIVKNMQSYPLARYYRDGMRVSINTDDRQIFGVSLTGEYLKVARASGLSLQDLQHIAIESLEGAFLPGSRKRTLLNEFVKEFNRLNSAIPTEDFLVRQR